MTVKKRLKYTSSVLSDVIHTCIANILTLSIGLYFGDFPEFLWSPCGAVFRTSTGRRSHGGIRVKSSQNASVKRRLIVAVPSHTDGHTAQPHPNR